MENNFDSYLYYCRNYSLFARWQRYMSQDDNHEYNYFIKIWSNAQYFANEIANDKHPLPQLERMLSFLPFSPNDNIKSYYNICIMHTIWVITGDKRVEKWILYWTEVANEEVKRINRGEDSVSELFCDFMSTIKKYKRVLIDINKGLVDIFNDLSIMSWRYDKSKVMNDEERADFINKLIDILSDVDINDVEEYETTITETKAITKAITDETKTETDETITKTETETEEESVDVILQNYNALNKEDFISAMRKAIKIGWIEKIEDSRYRWIGPTRIGTKTIKGDYNAALAYFIAKALKIKMELKPDKTPTEDSYVDINNKFPENYDIKEVFGLDIQSDQLVNALRAKNIQKWRKAIDDFFDEELVRRDL